MNRRWLTLGGVALAAGAAGLAFRQCRDINDSAGAAGSGSLPPGSLDAGTPEDFWNHSVERLDGSVLPLASLKGRRVIVNFWATWCPPCLREMPLIDNFYREFGPASGPKGWHVLGLAIDRREPVAHFLQRHPVSYEIALAGPQGTELGRALGNAVGGLPFTVAIDAQAQVIHRKLGEIKEAELRQWAAS